ncbi:MAG: metallophosphoesterase [Candidatus Paceibacterota bacterium]|jgi:hypothetical protein
MKFILVSDVHLLRQNPVARKDNLVENQFKKFEFILQQARIQKADILCAADFCDIPRSWVLLPRIISLLKDYEDVRLHTVFGQHDTYLYSEETRDRTTLGVLEKAGLVTVLDSSPLQITGEDRCVTLYGCSFGADVPVPVVSSRSTMFNVLVIHASISDRSLYPGQEPTMAKKFLESNKNFDLIVCGDIHRSFMVKAGKRFLFDVGPMLRREATQYNFSHVPHVVFFDTEKLTYEEIEIPHKPADEVLDRSHIDRVVESKDILEGFVSEIESEDTEKVSFEEILWSLVKANKGSKSVEKVLSETMEERS